MKVHKIHVLASFLKFYSWCAGAVHSGVCAGVMLVGVNETVLAVIINIIKHTV